MIIQSNTYTVYGVIYCGTNNINGKQYIGQTTNSNSWKRINGHGRLALKQVNNSILYSAIREYGFSSFSFEIIWTGFDKKSLDLAEQSFIQLLDTRFPNGYNLREGGSAGKHSPTSKEKMRNSALIERSKPGSRERMSVLATIAASNLDVKKKMSLARIEVESRPGMRDRRVADQIAAMAREEVKIKHRAAVLAAMQRPEVLNNLSGGMIRVLANPEIKLKMRLAKLGRRWINNGIKSRMVKPDTQLPEGWFYGRI